MAASPSPNTSHEAGSGTGTTDETLASRTTSFRNPGGLYSIANVTLPSWRPFTVVKLPLKPFEVRIVKASLLEVANPLIRLRLRVPSRVEAKPVATSWEYPLPGIEPPISRLRMPVLVWMK